MYKKLKAHGKWQLFFYATLSFPGTGGGEKGSTRKIVLPVIFNLKNVKYITFIKHMCTYVYFEQKKRVLF